ncbi:MAG: hypothetical protein KC422_06900 [Trueperaceae bacterium]|nr:hypothetical protein [Trueperaceae bacterium]
MYKLEITLPDDIAKKLQEAATQLNISPEEMAADSIAEKLERYAVYKSVAKHVLKKNSELYKRLA